MLDGYEDGHDEDDEKGSRSVPSRTAFGNEAAFVKDFPSYGRPRWRLFRWERNFGYRCVLTCAQIELMQADLPHTLFDRRNDREPEKNTKASDEVLRLQEEANRQMLARKKAKGADSYEIEELFN